MNNERNIPRRGNLIGMNGSGHYEVALVNGLIEEGEDESIEVMFALCVNQELGNFVDEAEVLMETLAEISTHQGICLVDDVVPSQSQATIFVSEKVARITNLPDSNVEPQIRRLLNEEDIRFS